jgi:uncharacterized heparinase superfamily protein
MASQHDSSSWLRRGVRSFAFGNPLYNLTLGGRQVTGLVVVPTDPWPGDAATGHALIQGQFRLAGEIMDADEPVWVQDGAGRPWLAALNGFEWLRDLRAAGGDAARRHARMLVSSWLDRNYGWNSRSWAPDILGARIANWISLHDFYCQSADDAFRARVFDSLARQTRHLSRVGPGPLAGADLIAAVRGLIFGGVALPGGEKALAQGLRLLEQELPRQVLPDGGHIERNPEQHMIVLRHLIDIRAALRCAKAEIPEALQHTIDRMTPALRFFRHVDGTLGLFNGGQEADPAMIEAVLTQADARGRPLKSAPHSGFERLLAGRTLILMDTGRPPPRGLDHEAHAGLLSFEISIGRERMIVNCGAHPARLGPWRAALAATAAHSTITVADTNSAEVLEGGGLGRRPGRITCERLESDGATLVEASHDGYVRAFGLVHRRRLYLSDNGEDLRGEDTLEGPGGHNFVLRFHLHPHVQVSLIQNGTAALMRLPSGMGWRLRASGGALGLSESIYLGSGDDVRHSRQITVTGDTVSDRTVVKWALRREKKPS